MSFARPTVAHGQFAGSSFRPTVGQPCGGGFYAGSLLLGSTLHALVVAPRAGGEALGRWLATHRNVAGADSYCDGRANTIAMADAGSDLALWALGLTLGGYHDWHVPARDELELLYRHFKPTGERDGGRFRDGENPSSVPVGYPYETASPVRTSIREFQAGGAEAFEICWYWASTQHSDYGAWGQVFQQGRQDHGDKRAEAAVRVVRLMSM